MNVVLHSPYPAATALEALPLDEPTEAPALSLQNQKQTSDFKLKFLTFIKYSI
jgi:hypothetical protein